MMQDLLQHRRQLLIEGIRASSNTLLHTDAWLIRTLDMGIIQELFLPTRQAAVSDISSSRYEGYPRVAALGFTLGVQEEPTEHCIQAFLAGLRQLQQRPIQGTPLINDDVALLGIADGLARLLSLGGVDVQEPRRWLLDILNDGPTSQEWSGRMRALAGDLLDQRGRLHMVPEPITTDILALELVLRTIWSSSFPTITPPTYDPGELLQRLLTEPLPDDTERCGVWLRSLDLAINETGTALAPVADGSPARSTVPYPLVLGGHASGLAPAFLAALRQRLLQADEFRDQVGLAALFVDARLTPWRAGLPEADNRQARVDAIIAYLVDKRNSADIPALKLFLNVLHERRHPQDAQYDALRRLAAELDSCSDTGTR